MPSEHLQVDMVKRSNGQASTSSSCYMSASKMTDERTGEVHDYRRKKGVDYSTMIAPAGSPEWTKDPKQVWNKAESASTRKDAQPARKIVIGLHRELTPTQNAALLNEFVRDEVVNRHGMIAQVNLHDMSSDNPHSHLQMATRKAGPDGFGLVERAWQKKSVVEGWRERWQELSNKHLEMAGSDVRIDMGRHAAQSTSHDGPALTAMRRKAERLGDQINQLELAEQQQPENEVNQEQRQSIDQLIRETTTVAPTPRPRDGGISKAPSLK